jgi:hypothetical protein
MVRDTQNTEQEPFFANRHATPKAVHRQPSFLLLVQQKVNTENAENSTGGGQPKRRAPRFVGTACVGTPSFPSTAIVIHDERHSGVCSGKFNSACWARIIPQLKNPAGLKVRTLNIIAGEYK